MKSLKIPHADHRYIDALKNNKMDLIEEIYEKCSNTITRMVISNKGSVEDAKDLFQETLISIYRQANEGFILTCPLEQFMYIACKRKWINSLRKKNLQYQGDFTEILKFETTIHQNNVSEIEEAISFEDRAELVREKLKMLGPSCKEIIKLSWVRNENEKYKSWKEIANQLDLSYGYVRKKAAECKERLIQLVKKDPLYNQLK